MTEQSKKARERAPRSEMPNGWYFESDTLYVHYCKDTSDGWLDKCVTFYRDGLVTVVGDVQLAELETFIAHYKQGLAR